MNNKTTGIGFPLQAVNGNLVVASESDLFKGHILSWLQTEIKERVMRPAYGMSDYLFGTAQDISRMRNNILTGLQSYIPQISFNVEGSLNDKGQVEFFVYWTYLEEESTLRIII